MVIATVLTAIRLKHQTFWKSKSLLEIKFFTFQCKLVLIYCKHITPTLSEFASYICLCNFKQPCDVSDLFKFLDHDRGLVCKWCQPVSWLFIFRKIRLIKKNFIWNKNHKSVVYSEYLRPYKVICTHNSSSLSRNL